MMAGIIQDRHEFRQAFGTRGPVVLPVIHVLDTEQTARNIDILLTAGAPGCFLINHDFEKEELLPILRDMRGRYPSLWMGVNFLAVTGAEAFPILGDLARDGTRIDAYWADDACIDEDGTNAEARRIAAIRESAGWAGLYFGGTAFKKQRAVAPDRFADAAREATGFMDVVTTSGIATGQEADLEKIATFRRAIGDAPLAIASGITPENARSYRDVDCFMVATGINQKDDFYNIDAKRLAALLALCRTLGEEDDRV